MSVILKVSSPLMNAGELMLTYQKNFVALGQIMEKGAYKGRKSSFYLYNHETRGMSCTREDDGVTKSFVRISPRHQPPMQGT